MLVLSRRADQELLFPNLDIKVRVLQVKGKVVRLGIEAPRGIPILRPEACDEVELSAFRDNFDAGLSRHKLRNRLNAINLGVRLAQKQLESAMSDDAEVTLQRLLKELQEFDEEVGHARDRVRLAAKKRDLRLMVVEDDDNERELLAGLLRMHGFNVRVASNGVEAMDLLEKEDLPDLLLLDMKMPQLGGPEIISRVRASQRLQKIRVYAVTGTSPGELGISERGCDGWFSKPLDPEQLIKAVTQDDALTTTTA